MTWMDNFLQATVIMCLGMGLVFLFVSSLVVLIQISARVFSKYAHEEHAVAPVATASAASQGAIVAAIAMALKKHSSNK